MTMRRGAFCPSIGWTAEGVPTCAPVCGGIERASWNGPCVDLAPTRVDGWMRSCGNERASVCLWSAPSVGSHRQNVDFF